MYPMIFTLYDQLGKNGGQGAVQGISDIFLIVVFPWRMYGDTVVFRAIGRRCPDSPYVGTMAGLRHGKTSEELGGPYIV